MTGAEPAHLLFLLFLPTKLTALHFCLCPAPHGRGASYSDLLLVGKGTSNACHYNTFFRGTITWSELGLFHVL